jgi:hypothetical protein
MSQGQKKKKLTSKNIIENILIKFQKHNPFPFILHSNKGGITLLLYIIIYILV